MRLIDADSIHYTRLLSEQGLDMELVPRAVINRMPTIDAEPVRHGRWKYRALYKFNSKGEYVKYCDIPYCSECGREYGTIKDIPFCNCGAKMDLED